MGDQLVQAQLILDCIRDDLFGLELGFRHTDSMWHRIFFLKKSS